MQLDELPYEILFIILSRTSPSTALKLGTVNKSLLSITGDDQLWKLYCCNNFPVDKCNFQIPLDWLWKDCYKHFTWYGVQWKPKYLGVELLENGYAVECIKSTDFPRFKVVLGSIHLSETQNSFEVKIVRCEVKKSELVNYITYGSGDAQIGVGIATSGIYNKFIGSDVSYNRAYYNDGMIGHGGTTAPFASEYKEGDTVGVQVDFRNGLLSFFHNKICVEIFLAGAPPLYPAVCMREMGDCVLMMLPSIY